MQPSSMLPLLLLIIGCLFSSITALSTSYPSTTPEINAGVSNGNPQTPGYRTAGYYVNWATYQRNFQVWDIQVNTLTHILYAFADVRSDTGEVFLADTWADTDKRWINRGDTWNDTGKNVYGNVKQIFKLKKENRNVKVLLSIGGWTWSSHLKAPVATEAGRLAFADSAVKIITDIGFDGIDIDWGYPENDEEANNLVVLLQTVRQKLDEYATAHALGYHFLLTVASPAGPTNYAILHLAEMDKFLDFWNLMAYDYAGSFDQNAAHTANLHKSTSSPLSTPFNTDQAIAYYTSHGVPADKIVLGMPLNGRSFENTAGPGTPFSGVGMGSWEQGSWDYKALPRGEVVNDVEVGASYSFDGRTMISYDTPEIAVLKAQYIKAHGLGGGMWWELSGDKIGSDSLVQHNFGGIGALERRENLLDYPVSQWENIKNKNV